MKIYSGINRNRQELWRYCAVGISTTVFNIAVYQILIYVGIDYWIGNAIAIVGSKIYAYLTNKFIVFHSHCTSFMALLQEIMRFIFARGFTGVIDYFGLIFVVEILGADQIISKYIIQIVVIILNYYIGKSVVFNKQEIRK